MISASILLIGLLSISQVHGDVVVVNVFSNEVNKTFNYETCGLFRSQGTFRPNKELQLFNLDLYTYCHQIQNDTGGNGTLFNQNAVFFMPITPFDCSFKRMANNLLVDGASLALIGTDGPINFSYVDPTNNMGMVFFPQASGQELKKNLNASTKSRVVLRNYSNQFDLSILIVIGLALLIVIAVAEWNLYKFKKRLGNKASKIKAPTMMNNPEITSVSKRIESLGTNNLSSHPSINELPLPPIERPGGQAQQSDGNTTNNNGTTKFDASKVANKMADKVTDFAKNDRIKEFSFDYLKIGVIFLALVGLVILVYFLYSAMAWIISVFFVFVAGYTFYSFGKKIIDRLKFLHFKVPENNLPFLKKRPKILSLVWVIFVVLFCLIWLGFRRSDWAWVFQDIMVLALVKYALSFNMFRSYHLVMVFLIIMAIYETFMIFILPLFAKKATIFTAVAFGFKTSYDSWYERIENKNLIDFRSRYDFDWLPLYLIIPNSLEMRKVCNAFWTFPYTALGIGDILVPAISLNYALIYDVARGKKFPLFFFSNLCAFIFGYLLLILVASFVNSPLPPLLFLAPIQIGVNYLVPYLKKDLEPYFNGETIKEYSTKQINQLLE